MIRVNALLGKLISNTSSDFHLFSLYTSSFDYAKAVCPCCKSTGNLSYHASYKRYLISLKNGKRQDQLIQVPRAICSNCARTHAILPDVLIPYGSYSIRFILTVLYLYSMSRYSVGALCQRFCISASTLYAWKELFLSHSNAFLSSLNKIISISKSAIITVITYPRLVPDFFLRFGFSYLQLRKTTLYTSPPFDG